ncbi:MAG: hypothetical protein HZA17_09395 [Nitrospirae bacterium]|nr:hypothetical protein [Nitrospirota bacterium]
MKLNEEIYELIRRYGLQEDIEHIIIPLPSQDGGPRRCFLLKRPYFRIAYPDGHYADYPLEEVIESIIRYPELSLREALYLLHKELDAHIAEIFGDERERSG